MPPAPSETPAKQLAEWQLFLRIDFSGSAEEVDRDIAALQKWFHDFLGKRAYLPTTGGLHYISANSTEEIETHLGRLAGISCTAVRELLLALQRAKGPLDSQELQARGHADNPERMAIVLQEMQKNLATVKKLLWKKRKRK